MTITETMNGDQLTIAVEGNMDTNTSPEVEAAILKAFTKSSDVLVDLKDCPYVSSAGLRAFLMGEKTAKSKKATMTLVNIQEPVMMVFRVSNFDRMLHIK